MHAYDNSTTAAHKRPDPSAIVYHVYLLRLAIEGPQHELGCMGSGMVLRVGVVMSTYLGCKGQS